MTFESALKFKLKTLDRLRFGFSPNPGRQEQMETSRFFKSAIVELARLCRAGSRGEPYSMSLMSGSSL